MTQWRDGDLEPREVEIERWDDAGGNVRGTCERRKVRLFANRKTVNIALRNRLAEHDWGHEPVAERESAV